MTRPTIAAPMRKHTVQYTRCGSSLRCPQVAWVDCLWEGFQADDHTSA